jgi:hypothetical protein
VRSIESFIAEIVGWREVFLKPASRHPGSLPAALVAIPSSNTGDDNASFTP